MSERALKRILTVAGVVVAAYLIVVLVRGGPGAGESPGATGDALAGIDPAAVNEVTFASPTDTVRLARSGSAWTVNGRAADSARVAQFLEGVGDARLGDVVARNPANHPRLGVSEDSAVAVTFSTGGGEGTTLLVGGSGPSYPSAYVRLPGDDPVHLFHGELRSPARRPVNEWRDREVVAVDTASVERVEVTRDGSAYTLARADSVWTVDGADADPSAVSSLLGELASLRASGFAPDTASLDDPARTLRVLDSAGETLAVLSIAPAEGSSFRITTGDASTIYEVSSYRVDRLTPDAESLRGSGGASGGTSGGGT